MIIWRFFRFWSILDGINAPENFKSSSCIINFSSIKEFWKNWHLSMNYWIIRYIFIPLGGTKNILFTSWIIFTFVATWHDLWIRWYIWAYINCLFVIIETLIESIFYKKLSKFLSNYYFKEEIYCFILSFYRPIIIVAQNAVNIGIDVFEPLKAFYSSISIVLIFALLNFVCLRARRLYYNETLYVENEKNY